MFYLITFVSIPTLTFYGSVISSVSDTGTLWGGFLEWAVTGGGLVV